MNEARVYADGFERSFAEVKDLLEFLAERGRNAKWIRKPTNTLRLAPLERRLKIWMRQMHPWKKFWRIQRRIRSLY